MLYFCPEHGEEASVGTLMELDYDAGHFFDRFRNPHVPDPNPLVERELGAAVSRMNEEGPTDEDYYRALPCAYPGPAPEGVRGVMVRWAADERADERGASPVDLLPDSLMTVRKVMRFAYEDGEDWLTELLEYERQEPAARAAVACEIDAARPAG